MQWPFAKVGIFALQFWGIPFAILSPFYFTTTILLLLQASLFH